MRPELVNQLKKFNISVVHNHQSHLMNDKNSSLFCEPFVCFRQGRFDIGSVGAFSYFGGNAASTYQHVESIGRFCSIAGNVIMGAMEHPTNFVSTSHILHGDWKNEWPGLKKHIRMVNRLPESIKKYQKWLFERKGKIVIGNDVWIEEGAFISCGVTIGDGAIVTARAVVTEDVPPYAIVGGIPAKVIQYRFEHDIIDRFLALRWWAYGMNALEDVDLTNQDINNSLDQIEANIKKGAKVYCPLRVEIKQQEFVGKVSPKISNITQGRPLDVYIPFGDKLLKIDFNIHQERAYYFERQYNRQSIDSIIAKTFMEKGDVVADIGANIGFTALTYLEVGASKVHAFEPEHEMYERLSEHQSDELICYRYALSDKAGEAELLVSTEHPQGSTLNHSMVDVFPYVYKNAPTQKVKIQRLDQILDFASFIKIDTEGNELDVLKGMTKLLSSDRKPRIIQVEIYPKALDEVLSFMKLYYSRIKRAHINKEYQIVLHSIGDLSFVNKEYLHTPPTYLFLK